MKPTNLLAATAALLAFCSASATAQTWSPPAPEARCPSKWGAGDERGAANLMTPELVLRATRLIKSGEVVELGHVLAMDMPLFGTRRFDVHTKRTGGPMGTNKRYTNEELVITELGQVQQPLQLLQDRRDHDPQRFHQARRRKDRLDLHARRPDRRSGIQRRGHAAAELRDHGR